MITYIGKQRKHPLYRILSGFIAFTFIFSMVVPPTAVFAQTLPTTILNLPAPGTLVPLTSGFTPPLVNGITIYPDDPFKFNFLVGRGDNDLRGEAFTNEAQKLIKYFLASLTVPEEELWVNLSPYEQDRIIPDSLSRTEMGRDLLAQDYMLKQLTASLMYPEDELGEHFWNRIREKVQNQYGTDELPVDTFNKVWIVPQDAVVYETANTVVVVDSYLKVMLESDYEALRNEMSNAQLKPLVSKDIKSETRGDFNSPEVEQIIREVIIPAIEVEVNEGETFANLRQIYNSMILATWYKQNLKESLLGQVYVDQKKVSGIDTVGGDMKDKIYQQYLEAFKVGVYNYIKEELDPATQEIIPRKYFAGGFAASGDVVTQAGRRVSTLAQIRLARNEEVEVALELPGTLAAAASPVGGNEEEKRSQEAILAGFQNEVRRRSVEEEFDIMIRRLGWEKYFGQEQYIASPDQLEDELVKAGTAILLEMPTRKAFLELLKKHQDSDAQTLAKAIVGFRPPAQASEGKTSSPVIQKWEEKAKKRGYSSLVDYLEDINAETDEMVPAQILSYFKEQTGVRVLSNTEKRELRQKREDFGVNVVARVAAELFYRQLPGKDAQVQEIIDTSENMEEAIDRLILFFENLHKRTERMEYFEGVLNMLRGRIETGNFTPFTKEERGKKGISQAIKGTHDVFAKRIFERAVQENGIIAPVRASEGFGLGTRDKVEESLMANESVLPGELAGQAEAIQDAVDMDFEYYVDSQTGNPYLIADTNVDVVEGTNDTVGAERPLGAGVDNAGGTSTMTYGLGVRSIGNTPDGYIAGFIKNFGDETLAEEFRRETVTEDGVVYELSDPELYSQYPRHIGTYLEFLADSQGIALSDLKEKIIIMDRPREAALLNVLRELQEEIPGLTIVTNLKGEQKGIKDGTVAHGLKAAMTEERVAQMAPEADYQSSTFLTIGGSAEMFMKLGVIAMLDDEGEGVVTDMRIFSALMGKDDKGQDMESHERRYAWSDEEVEGMRELRLDDAEYILYGSKDNKDQPAQGRELFTEESVFGDVMGVFAFLNNNEVFQQPGPRYNDDGQIEVRVMRLGKIDGEFRSEILTEVFDPKEFAAAASPVSALNISTRRLLDSIAARMVTTTGGILAADESLGTAAKRLKSIGVPDEEIDFERRQDMRRVFLSDPEAIKQAGIDSVIVHDEHFDYVGADGKNLIKGLKKAGITVIYKSDIGLVDMPDGLKGEKLPHPDSLKNLWGKLARFKKLGAEATKWRTTFVIDPKEGSPSDLNILNSNRVLAQSAVMTQKAGLLPIVEPEVLHAGTHSIDDSYKAMTRVLSDLFKQLEEQGAYMPGISLKTHFVLSGDKAENRASPQEVGYKTLKVLLAAVPPEVSSIVFLSGGQGDQEAIDNLDAVIKASRTKLEDAIFELYKDGEITFEKSEQLRKRNAIAWLNKISYSYGRGLQGPALKAWGADNANLDRAQDVFLKTIEEVNAARNGELGSSPVINARMKENLDRIADQMVSKTGGILAADESPGTAKKRLLSIGVSEDDITFEKRQDMRRVFLTEPELIRGAGIDAVIVHDEHFEYTDEQGNNLVQGLRGAGITIIYKSDIGLVNDPYGIEGEKLPKPDSLKDLEERLLKFNKLGAQATKWRTTFTIDPARSLPTQGNIGASNRILAQSAVITQKMGMLPIVEPEVLHAGTHSIDDSYETMIRVLSDLFGELDDNGAYLPGISLKTHFVLSGADAQNRASPQEVGFKTLKALLASVPPDVNSVVFLSGGQGDQEAIDNLNAVVVASRERLNEALDELLSEKAISLVSHKLLMQENGIAWLNRISFSYGRGLQGPALKEWGADNAKMESAQAVFLKTINEVTTARNGELSSSPVINARTRANLDKIAARLVTDTGGILAADESPGTAKKRLLSIGVAEDDITFESRQDMRRVFLSDPEAIKEAGIDSVIVHDEHFDYKDEDGVNLVQGLRAEDIVIVYKSDSGLDDDPNGIEGEKIPKAGSIIDLDGKLAKFKKLGAEATKWRTTFTIDPQRGLPSQKNIEQSNEVLARTALKTQQAGLLPIVEPEVLHAGTHDIAASRDALTRVLKDLFRRLKEKGVYLPGVSLKTHFVLSGADAENRAAPQEVGFETLKVLLLSVPKEVSSIVFLSGGQGDQEAKENLNAVVNASKNRLFGAIHSLRDDRSISFGEADNFKNSNIAWIDKLSFSYGRGLQGPALKTWGADNNNLKAAQEKFLETVKVVTAARNGELSSSPLVPGQDQKELGTQSPAQARLSRASGDKDTQKRVALRRASLAQDGSTESGEQVERSETRRTSSSPVAVEERVEETIREHLQMDTSTVLNPTRHLSYYGADSLDVVEIVSDLEDQLLEDEIRVSIEDYEISYDKASVEYLVNLINSKIKSASSPVTFEEAVNAKRKPVIGYNMKGELLPDEVDAFLEGLAYDYDEHPDGLDQVEIVAFFAEGDLRSAREKINELEDYGHIPEGFIKLGAQNIRVQPRGAYTAHAPSIEQALAWGVEAVLLGHSEISTEDRGEPTYVESDQLIAEKVKLVVDAGLQPFVAFGETRNEKKANQTEQVLTRQLEGRLFSVTGEEMLKSNLVLAYEPVWAIGEGATPATTEDAEKYTKLSREIIYATKGIFAAAQTRIQYGGSMSAKNVAELSVQPNIDGGLIGGASKKAETAIPIHRAFAEHTTSSPVNVGLKVVGIIEANTDAFGVNRNSKLQEDLGLDDAGFKRVIKETESAFALSEGELGQLELKDFETVENVIGLVESKLSSSPVSLETIEIFHQRTVATMEKLDEAIKHHADRKMGLLYEAVKQAQNGFALNQRHANLLSGVESFEVINRFIEDTARALGDAVRDESENFDTYYDGLKLNLAELKRKFQYLQTRASSSPVSEQRKGGIDLDADHLNLMINRDGNGVPLPVSLQPLDIIHINGLIPVILHIAPVNVPMVLGLVDEETGEPYAGADSGDSPDAVRNEYFDRMVEDEELAAI